MADSHRLKVLKALTTRLETITIANGYQHDLAGLVFRGRSIYGASDPGTMLSLLEAPRADPGRYAGGNEARSEQWTLLLQGWAPDDAKHPSDPLYALADDVEVALSLINAQREPSGFPLDKAVYHLPDPVTGKALVTGFQFSPPIIRPPVEAVSSKSFFYMTLVVGLAVNVG